MNQGQLKELTDWLQCIAHRLDKLVERTEPMKDEMYIALRSYAEENSALLREVLTLLKAQQGAPATAQATTPAPVKVPPEAVGPVTVETVQTLDSGNEGNAAKGKPQGGKPGAKPAVNWNSAPIKE